MRLTVTDGNGLSAVQDIAVTRGAAETGGSGPFIKSGGLLSMEAENFHESELNNDPAGPNATWSVQTALAGYSGSGYAGHSPVNATTSWTSGSRITYRFQVGTAGTYKLWLRRYAASGSENSCYVGLDGVQLSGNAGFDNNTSNYNTWAWKSAGTPLTLSLSAGEHELQIVRRDNNYRIDKIVLTTNTSYMPSGEGPAESARASGNTGPSIALNIPTTGQTGQALGIQATVTDADGGPLPATASWSHPSGTGNAVFTDSSATSTTVTFDSQGTQVVRMIADDSLVATFAQAEIEVSSAGGMTYPLWMSGYSGVIPEPKRGPTEDFSGDGLPNLLKYAFGLDPTVVNAQGFPTGRIEGGYLTLSFRRRAGGSGGTVSGYVANDILYVPEVNDSLDAGGWLSGPEHLVEVGTPVDNSDGTETVTVRTTVPISSKPRPFIRLRVTMLP